MERVKIILEGVEIPQHLVSGIEVAYPFNSLSYARVALASDVETPGLFKGEGAYEKVTALLLKGYPDVKIMVDGQVIFEGIVTKANVTRSYGSSGMSLECVSHFVLGMIYKMFLLNLVNFEEQGLILSQGSVYPVVQDIGSETAMMIKKLEKLLDAIREKKYRDKDPVKLIAEKILKPSDEEKELLAVQKWYKDYYEIFPLHEYVDSFTPNTRHIFRLLAESSQAAEAFLKVLSGSIFKERLKVESPWEMFLKLINMFQLYTIEMPTAKGLSIVVKPMMLFHPPPKSNLIPSHHLISFSISEETGIQKPTRTYVIPYTLMTGLADNVSPIFGGAAIAGSYVVAPEELEKEALLKVAEELGLGVSQLKEKSTEEVAKAVFEKLDETGDTWEALKNFHKDINKILTEEEKSRGVIPNYYSLPPGVSEAINSLPGFYRWLLLKEIALNAHYMTRAQLSQAQVAFHYNPFVIPGHGLVFTDGSHFYYGFVVQVSHSISPNGMVTAATLINFTRLNEDEDLDQFAEYVSVFEMVENGAFMQSFDKDYMSKYYKSMFGTDLGSLEDLKELEKLKYSDLSTVTQETYNFWFRPLSTSGKPVKIDKSIQEMVKTFVEDLMIGSW